MGNLLNHAERELKLAGLDKEDSDYGGMLYHSTLKLIKCFADEGHSGMSASIQIELFNRLARFKALTPLTNNPNEWMEVGINVWQNNRDSECFSTDGGKTYYNLNDRGKIITAKEAAL